MAVRKRDLLIVARLMADILYAYGFFLLLPAAVGLATGDYALALTFAIGSLVLVPLCIVLRKTSSTGVELRHAAVTLAVAWISLSLISGIPFRVQGMPWVDALFESFSAWTDTGLTMIPDPGNLPVSLSFFRVLMQWISGLGIVMFMLSLHGPSPRAARSLFQAEGRFEDFATNLWQVGRTIVLIYLCYTLLGFVLLWLLGVPPLHALAHAITSLSTGGFSTNSVGVGMYGRGPSLVAMLLMLGGGISFGSHQALVSGNIKKFVRNPEIRVLVAVIVVAWGLLMLEMWQHEGNGRPLESAFYAVSAISTCGAGTTLSLSQVPDAFVFTVMLLMISGAAYGSTTGALKLWRLIILGKVIGREVRRPFYPTGTVMPIRMGNNVIADATALQVGAYVSLYLALGLLGSLIFMLFGHRPLDALFTVFSAQGNVGLNAMPDALYYGMHPLLKIQLILHMLLGRMEIFPLLYLLRGLHRS